MNLINTINAAIKQHEEVETITLDYVIAVLKGEPCRAVKKHKLKTKGWQLKAADIRKLKEIFPLTPIEKWVYASN